jgi:hypothetical protein
MGGGLMQLVAYGAQDIYLTGNPQITFFKVVYRRHTNFSMETIEQTINGGVAVNGNSTVTISRNGDLVYKIYVTNAGSSAITNGSSIVSEVELEIGGQRIDRHYEEWNQIWNELTTPESKAIGFKSMIGDVGTSGSTGPVMTQYPLNFWFCRNPGLALPLIALQYHEVKLKFTWGSLASKGVDTNVKVVCDYIYLDTDERRRFAQVSHEYLIEQIQKQSFSGSASNKLNFNHPVKELIWTSQRVDGYTTAKLKLNGHDRFAEQNAEYFNLRQPLDYHTSIPGQNLPYGAVPSLREVTLTKPTTLCGTHTNGQGIATQDAVIGDLTWVGASGTAIVVMSGGPPAADAVIADTTTGPTNAFVIGGLTSTSAIIDNGLRQGDIHRITLMDNAKLATDAAGRPLTTFIGTVKYICAPTGLTTVLNGGASGPLNDNIVIDQVIDAGANSVDSKSILVIYEESFTFQVALVSTKDAVKIEKIGERCARTSKMLKQVNCYSFALKPEEHQPSGTCNFSRIDTAKLDFTGTSPTSSENIYAVNYNVLRIMSGMGGLAYSN